MRYRIGQDPANLTGQAVGEDGLTIFTAVFSLITGIIFVIGGIRGRQRWLMLWGAGLVLVSLAYLGSVIFS